jgi:hypothetical protein
MRFTYELRKRDLLFAHTSALVRNRILLFLTVVWVAFNTYSCSKDLGNVSLGLRIVWMFFSALVITCLLGAFFLLINVLLILSRKHTGIVGEHTLEIKEDGLEETTTVNRSLHRWNPAFRINKFGPHVWIFTTDTQFFLIPKTPEAHDGNLEEFLAALRSRMNQTAG